MLGAIIGDIVGSRFERDNHKSKKFQLFTRNCSVTDDSIMTLAVAKAVMEASALTASGIEGSDDDFYQTLSDLTVKYMKRIGRRYPACGFGGTFLHWVFSDDKRPYHSYGNGAAMRVSPAGFAARDEWEAAELAQAVTEVTHDHPEGIKGAKATAAAIFLARQGALKSEIREHIRERYYNLDFTIDAIRPSYQFDVSCQGTVPQAIECFLESASFEDALRTAVSLGGDSDTIAAITGAIAEAYYGIPEQLKEQALPYLDDPLRAIYDEWIQFAPPTKERFRLLTKYIGKISAASSSGEWTIDESTNGSAEHPIHLPYVDYSRLLEEFLKEFYGFWEAYPEYELSNYPQILEENGLIWGSDEMRSANLQDADEQVILALIMAAIRAERFGDGILLGLLEDGSLMRWLKRLKDIDWKRQERTISSIEWEKGGFFGGSTTYLLAFQDGGAELRQNHTLTGPEPLPVKVFAAEEADHLKESFENIHPEYWNSDYTDPSVCDGEQWHLKVVYSDGSALVRSGSNAYPENWDALLEFFKIGTKVPEAAE